MLLTLVRPIPTIPERSMTRHALDDVEHLLLFSECSNGVIGYPACDRCVVGPPAVSDVR